MVLGTRENVSGHEEKLLKLLGPVGEVAAKAKKKRDSRYALTASRLCEIAGLETASFSDAVKARLSDTVSSVCRAGSRFTRDCICVQFQEDGDQVIHWAMEHGALFCITRTQIDDLPCVPVENPEQVYADMCKYYRELSDLEVTAVVGSIGKTTTKRMISAVYAAQYHTFADPENENQIDCVGYIFQHIPKGTQKLVQEVSEDTPGCLGLISHMIGPKIAVVTAIDKSHIEAFGSEEKILEEIASVTRGMPADGKVILNIDDENTKNLIKDRPVVTVSLENPNADFYAGDITLETDGLSFCVTEKATGKRYPVKLNMVFAKHNVFSALYAFAAGVCAGVAYKNILKGLAAYRTVGIRQNVYQAKGTILYVDCYNAVARSMRAAIQAADEIPASGKRIAVLGDIEEAGAFSDEIHKEVIAAVDASQFDVLLLYGEKMLRAAEKVKVRDTLEVVCFTAKSPMSEAIRSKHLKTGDIVLFKSSRKSALEEVIKMTWPVTYRLKMLEYYWPIIKWRLKVILS